ncbi:MAG TPA: DUF6732 family protein [Paracoccaceae bacterium]|nr:DUF6732 family protein [Paracoccaceae bacterium]
MRKILVAMLALAGGPALAHPGHVTAAEGHSHWLALALIAAAAAIGAWRLLQGRRGTGDAVERGPVRARRGA